LLGLDPHSQLVPADNQMTALNLVDARQSVDALVAQAISNGPGVRELDGILCAIHSGVAASKGLGRFAPIVGFQMDEGAFGANAASGPFTWADRFDAGIEAKWKISDLFLADKKRDVASNQICQVQLAAQDLRAKLTMGVHEAKSAIDAAAGIFPTSEKLITEGNDVVKQLKLMKENPPPTRPGETPKPAVLNSDVVAAYRKVMDAQLDYVDMMREYDKAQLRLMIITGPCSQPAGEPVR
jgi:hypothetical protein